MNILGGLHHAKALVGEGFCFFADVAIAFRKLRSSLGIEDMLIVDLDAHQGNGNASILGKDPNVRIMDVFNRQIYPSEKGAVERVRYCYPIASKTTDAEYLDKVRNGLERVLQDGRPQLIVYIAGYDVLIGDPLGQLSLSLQGCVERDCLVWQFAIEHEIPILMLLAGGYGAAAGEAAGYCAAQCLVRFTAAGNAQPRETGPTTVPSGSEETS